MNVLLKAILKLSSVGHLYNDVILCVSNSACELTITYTKYSWVAVANCFYFALSAPVQSWGCKGRLPPLFLTNALGLHSSICTIAPQRRDFLKKSPIYSSWLRLSLCLNLTSLVLIMFKPFSAVNSFPAVCRLNFKNNLLNLTSYQESLRYTG